MLSEREREGGGGGGGGREGERKTHRLVSRQADRQKEIMRFFEKKMETDIGRDRETEGKGESERKTDRKG